MIRLLLGELMKIRRSLIWLVVLVIPGLIALPFYFATRFSDETIAWIVLFEGVGAMWAWFLLPMSITIITALMGQVEHRYNTWSFAMSLPQAKWQVLLVKALVAVGIIALMSLLVMGASLLAMTLGAQTSGAADVMGRPPIDYFWRLMYRLFAASLLIVAIQFYVAIRFGGLAVPLLVGIGGTFFAILVPAFQLFGLSFENANYIPWMLPTNILSKVPDQVDSAMLIGGAGGVAAIFLVSLLLARRDWQ